MKKTTMQDVFFWEGGGGWKRGACNNKVVTLTQGVPEVYMTGGRGGPTYFFLG